MKVTDERGRVKNSHTWIQEGQNVHKSKLTTRTSKTVQYVKHQVSFVQGNGEVFLKQNKSINTPAN